jgi:pullulanase/glycogen debranching enzyme
MRLEGMAGDVGFYLIANAYHEALEFELPPDVRWRRVVDTALTPPDDYRAPDEAPLVSASHYAAAAHSVVLLIEDRA